MSKEESNNKGIIIKTIPLIENHSPIISGLIARPSNLEIGQQSELTCYAADEDKDELYSDDTEFTLKQNGATTITLPSPSQSGVSYDFVMVKSDGRNNWCVMNVQDMNETENSPKK